MKKIEFALFSVQNILYFFLWERNKKKGGGGKALYSIVYLPLKEKKKTTLRQKARVAFAL
jgi:hypothetical protein